MSAEGDFCRPSLQDTHLASQFRVLLFRLTRSLSQRTRRERREGREDGAAAAHPSGLTVDMPGYEFASDGRSLSGESRYEREER